MIALSYKHTKVIYTQVSGSLPIERSSSVLLQFDQVSKQFAGTLAIDQVSLELHSGEILALLGQNGAGKSTLIKMLAGIHKASSGHIRVQGKSLESYGGKAPIAFIHQDLGLLE
jgi:ribose transport system ATP-binding protein